MLEEKKAAFSTKINLSFSIPGEMKSDQVLDLELIHVQEKKLESDKTQWTVQRIHLSPQEKHLAATVISPHSAEPR